MVPRRRWIRRGLVNQRTERWNAGFLERWVLPPTLQHSITPERLSAFAAALAYIRHMRTILGDLLAALAADLCHMRTVTRDLGATAPANLSHVLSILRYL